MLTERGQPQSALACLKRAQQLSPHDVWIRAYIANASYADNDAEAARVEFLGILDGASPEAAIRRYWGTTLTGNRDYWAAIAQFERALNIDVQYVWAAVSKGDALLDWHDKNARIPVQAAREAYLKALAIRPDLPEGLLGLGRVSAAMGQRRDAIRYYRRALGRNPELIDARRNLAQSLSALGRTSDALREYRMAARSRLFSPANYDQWARTVPASQRTELSRIHAQARRAVEKNGTEETEAIRRAEAICARSPGAGR
jgi:tetratricopeptide (TPR) repeat protein